MSRGINVESGVGYRSKSADPKPMPIVRVTAEDAHGNVASLDLFPAHARRIGLDMIAAASASIAETEIRAWAKQHGEDADTVILWMRTGMDELLEAEGEIWYWGGEIGQERSDA